MRYRVIVRTSTHYGQVADEAEPLPGQASWDIFLDLGSPTGFHWREVEPADGAYEATRRAHRWQRYRNQPYSSRLCIVTSVAFTVPQIIEHFHLAFLDVLRTRVDVGRYVLKGGANLRYFFDSARYSEDIDLDIYGLEADWKFEEQIDNSLNGDALGRLLRSAGITIDPAEVTKPKQTATTRRWKVVLTASGHHDKIRTKIEFSGRGRP